MTCMKTYSIYRHRYNASRNANNSGSFGNVIPIPSAVQQTARSKPVSCSASNRNPRELRVQPYIVYMYDWCGLYVTPGILLPINLLAACRISPFLPVPNTTSALTLSLDILLRSCSDVICFTTQKFATAALWRQG